MYTYDVGTDVGKVRALVQDTDIENIIFQDDEIQVFLDIEGTVKCAGALALETIAGQQALILKVTKVLDLQVDGSKVAESLLAVAQRMRDTDAGDADFCGFDFAEQVDNSQFAKEEFLLKNLIQELV